MGLRRCASVCLLLFASAGAAVTQQVIPAVHGTTLSGGKVDLPPALEGKVGVLILGFSEASRTQASDWGRRLAGDYRESKTVVYFEMPVLESVPRILRGWVLKKIGESVPDRAKARFLPVLDHEREWKALASFGKADDAYVLVVDSRGTLRGRVEGAASDGHYAEVKRLLGTVTAAAP